MMHLRRSLPHRWWVDAGLLLLLLLFAVTVTVLYISQERNFHWWIDWYHRTTNIVDLLQSSPIAAWQQLRSSLASERNQLFTLPLVPFLLIFGQSHLVYEIALTLVYLVPFSLVMGAIATQLILYKPRPVFWSTAWLTLLIPVNWIPTFLGIPDTGGALFIALATWVYVQDVRLKQRWRVPTIGILLAIAVLLRRHFTYGVVAFLGALTLQMLLDFGQQLYKNAGFAWRNLISWFVRLGLIALTVMATLSIVAWEFTYAAITRNYGSLYASWSLPLTDMVERYLHFYGWFTWAIVLLGFVVGTVTQTIVPSIARFIGLVGGIALFEWVVKLRYGNVFYSLHITPLVITGLAAFFWTVRLTVGQKIRHFILGSCFVYCISNLLFGLMPPQQLGLTQLERFGFALNMPPLVRTDYNEITRLVDYLRQLAPSKVVDNPIYVVGTQRLQLNSAVLRAAENILYGKEESVLQVLTVPQFDSQDDYPLHLLLAAKYIVLPNALMTYPGQVTQVPVAGEWVLPQEQDLVKVVFAAFTQNWEIAQDFKPLPVQFALEDGVTVSVYERIRPTSIATAIRTFQHMQQQIGDRPGGQLDWLSLSADYLQTAIRQNQDGTYRLIVFADPLLSPAKPQLGAQTSMQENSASFLYVGQQSIQSIVKGWLTLWDETCISASVEVSTYDSTGNKTSSTALVQTSDEAIDFSYVLSSQKSDYLILSLLRPANSADGTSYCTVDINNLLISDSSPPASGVN
jgi:hypothetical protein